MKILGGSFLSQEDLSKIFPFMVYVTFLLMLIITNGYLAESTSRAIKNNSNTIRDLRVKYTTAESEYIKESQKEIMIERLAKDGLKESLETRTIKQN